MYPVLTVNPASETSATAISVTMSATDADGDAVSIYYTQNGTTPTAASTKYTAAFSVTTTKTIKAIAIDAKGGASAVTSVITQSVLHLQDLLFTSGDRQTGQPQLKFITGM